MSNTKIENRIVTHIFKNLLIIQIMAIIAATLGSMVDGIVIGNFLGTNAMAAFGIVSPLIIIQAAVSGVFSSGAQTLCGKFMGRGNAGAVNRVFSITCLALVALGAVLTVLCMVFGEPLVVLLGAQGETLPLAKAFLVGLALGIVPNVLTSTLSSFMQLDSDAPRAFFAILTMTITNIILDLLNVFVFQGGMLGMALATSASYCVSLLILVLHFFKPSATIRLVVKGLRPGELSGLLVVGLPSAVSRVCTMLRTVILNRLLLFLAGDVAVAALAVQNSLGSLIGAVSIGIGMTTLLVVSVVMGEEDRKSVCGLMSYAIKWGIVISAALAVVVIAFAGPLAAAFGSENTEQLQLATRALRFFALSIPFNTVCVIFMSFFQSAENHRMANLVCVLDNVLYMVLLALALSPVFGTDGVWMSFLLAELLCLLTIWLIAWRHSHRLPRRIDDFLLLPSGFGVPAKDRLDITVQNMSEVVRLSEESWVFCEAHGIEARRTYYVSLCIEEMAGNIVQYGFQDRKRHTIDIRLAYKEGSLLLHIRDDCKPFNPGAVQAVFNPEDPCANIGIRLVSQLAQRMEYQSTLNTNNLRMVI
ncbi:MAG: ATP-binding protein [Coriobacteriales bacterium]|nr:ATP-binding protein [Coriobacteriales bacterium]